MEAEYGPARGGVLTKPQCTLSIYRLGHEQDAAKQTEREWLGRRGKSGRCCAGSLSRRSRLVRRAT